MTPSQIHRARGPRRAPRLEPRLAPPSSSKWERFLLFLLPLAAALGPLTPSIGPLFAFRVIILLLFIGAIINGKRSRDQSSPLRTSVYWLTAVGALCALFLAVFRGVGEYGASELLSIFIGAMLVLAFMLLPVDGRLVASLIAGWVLAFVVTGSLAIYEARTGWRAPNHFSFRDPQGLLTDDGTASTFGNPNDYAHFALLSSVIFLAGLAVVRRRSTRVLLTLGALAGPVCVVMSESFLGVGIAAVILLAVVLVRVPLASPTLIILLGVGALFVAGFPGGIASLLSIDPAYIALFNEGRTGAVRTNLLVNGLRFSVETGFTGLGPGGFETRMSMAGGDDRPTYGILSPHSGFTEVLSQYGLLPTIAMVVVLFQLARVGWRVYRASQLAIADRFAGLALLIYVFLSPVITMMGSSNLDPSYTWMIFAAMLLIGRWLHEKYVRSPRVNEYVARVGTDALDRAPAPLPVMAT